MLLHHLLTTQHNREMSGVRRRTTLEQQVDREFKVLLRFCVYQI